MESSSNSSQSSLTKESSPSPSPPPSSKKAAAPPTPVRLPHRVADYFVVIGGVRQEIHTDVKGSSASIGNDLDGSRKTHTKLVWTPKILDRYPRVDFNDAEFPKDLEMFCFPATYELSMLCHAPESHCFILTEADGTRIYGTALRYWEVVDESRLSQTGAALSRVVEEEEEMIAQQASSRVSVAGGIGGAPSARPSVADKKGSVAKNDFSGQLVYAPKCILLLSHWPFYTNFERFLSTLHKNLYIHSDGNLVPIERVLCNFINEIPLPPQGKVEVECRSFMNPFMNAMLNTCPWVLNTNTSTGMGVSIEKKYPFLFSRPPPNKHPLHDFPISTLFRWLSLDNIFTLFAAVLTERRILFISDKLHKLTIAAETITYLCCPFYWRHIYIPILPSRLTDYICAPMPYIVGIHRSYMVDDLLLDSVIQVDLDNNTISTISAGGVDSIPALPTERQASLSRHLKKLVIDPTIPLKPSQTMSDSDIEAAFLKFHVRLFSKYRNYLEAPSESVIDKFQKDRFVNEHPEKGQFLVEFMETQMFQCFVDDRYDQFARVSKAGSTSQIHFECLFFDEHIDLSEGRSAPFLQDSSQNINPSNRVIALAPSTEGLPKGALYKYSSLPVPLSSKLFGSPREIKDLAGDSTSSGVYGGRRGMMIMDMEKVNLKFFEEKRLYSQHFHTLRLKSAKQDSLFKDITKYFKSEQTLEENYIKELEKSNIGTVDKDSSETGTTIDAGWTSLKSLIQSQLLIFADSYKIIREETCVPLYAQCAEKEFQLKILFQEANLLEAKAAKGKANVERAKAQSMLQFSRYENLKENMRQNILSPSEINRIVAAQNESEDSRLDLDESETSFQTIVAEYEMRMPQIISTIRQLNKERIVQLKAAMTKWVQSRRMVLNSMLAQLDSVDKQVSAIDAEKDLVSFSEGTTDFWAAATRGTTMDSSAAGHGNNRKSGQLLPNLDGVPTAQLSNSITTATEFPSPAPPEANGASASPPPIVTVPIAGTSNDASHLSLSPTFVIGSTPTVNISPVPPAAGATSTTPSSTTVVGIKAVGARRGSEIQQLNRNLCYPLHLWGMEGFERAATQASLTRKVMKELILCFSQWVEVSDLKGKKLQTVVRSLPELIGTSGVGLPSGYRQLWDTMKTRSLNSAKALTDFQGVLLKLISDLSLTKGELKMSLQRFREHRLKLEKEVAAANDVLLRSMEKKERTARALAMCQRSQQNPNSAVITPASNSGSFPAAGAARAAAAAGLTSPTSANASSAPVNNLAADLLSQSALSGVMSQKQLESQSALLERAAKEAKEAEHEHALNARNSIAIQRKHDICVARLLRLFEKKERYCTGEIKKALAVLTEEFHSILIQTYKKGDEAMGNAVKKIDVNAELKEFVEAATSTKLAATAPPPLPPGTNVASPPPGASSSSSSSVVQVDFGKHMGGPSGYTSGINLLQSGLLFVRATHALFEELALTDELEVKALKKASFKVRSCRPNTTLNAAALALEQLMDRLSEISDDWVRIGHELATPVTKLKSQVKQLIKGHETKYADIERVYRKALEEKEKAVASERLADDNLKAAHSKTDQATREEEHPGSAKKGLFSSFMSTPLKDLQAKEQQAQKELEKAHLHTSEKESSLLQATSKRTQELKELLQDIQATHVRTWKSHSEMLSSFCAKHCLHIEKMQTLAHNFSNKVVEINVENDALDFISKNQQTAIVSPPEHVKEDYNKYLEALAQQERMRIAAAKTLQDHSATAPVTVANVARGSPPPPTTPLPSTLHGYSNSTSLTHIPLSPHKAVGVPLPEAADRFDFTPMARSRGAATSSATAPVPATVPASAKSPPPPPPPMPSIRQSSQESVTSDASATPSAVAPASDRAPELSESSTSVAAGLLREELHALEEEKGQVYEFSTSRSEISTTESNTHTTQNALSNSSLLASNVEEEIQDENGDWIKRHSVAEGNAVLAEQSAISAEPESVEMSTSTAPAVSVNESSTTELSAAPAAEPASSDAATPSAAEPVAAPAAATVAAPPTPLSPFPLMQSDLAGDDEEEEVIVAAPTVARLVVSGGAPRVPLPVSKPIPPPPPSVVPSAAAPPPPPAAPVAAAAPAPASSSVEAPAVTPTNTATTTTTSPPRPPVASTPPPLPSTLPKNLPTLPLKRPKPGFATLTKQNSLMSSNPQAAAAAAETSANSTSSSVAAASPKVASIAAPPIIPISLTSSSVPVVEITPPPAAAAVAEPAPAAEVTMPEAVISPTNDPSPDETLLSPASSVSLSVSGARQSRSPSGIVVGSMLGGDTSSDEDETPAATPLATPSHHNATAVASAAIAAASGPAPLPPPPPPPPYNAAEMAARVAELAKSGSN